MDETGQPGGATPGINGNGRHHSEHTGTNGTWDSPEHTWSNAGTAVEPAFEPVVPIWRRPVEPPAPGDPAQPGGARSDSGYDPAHVDAFPPAPGHSRTGQPSEHDAAAGYPDTYWAGPQPPEAAPAGGPGYLMPEGAPSSEQDIPRQPVRHRAVYEDTPPSGMPMIGLPVWREATPAAPPGEDQPAGYDLVSDYPRPAGYEQATGDLGRDPMAESGRDRVAEPDRERMAEPDQHEPAGYQPPRQVRRYEPERYDTSGYESQWHQPSWNEPPRYQSHRYDRTSGSTPEQPFPAEPAMAEPVEPTMAEAQPTMAEPFTESPPARPVSAEPAAESPAEALTEPRPEPLGEPVAASSPSGRPLAADPQLMSPRQIPPAHPTSGAGPLPPDYGPLPPAPGAPSGSAGLPPGAGGLSPTSGPPSRPVRPVSGPPSRPSGSPPPASGRLVGPAALAPQPPADSGPPASSASPVASAPPMAPSQSAGADPLLAPAEQSAAAPAAPVPPVPAPPTTPEAAPVPEPAVHPVPEPAGHPAAVQAAPAGLAARPSSAPPAGLAARPSSAPPAGLAARPSSAPPVASPVSPSRPPLPRAVPVPPGLRPAPGPSRPADPFGSWSDREPRPQQPDPYSEAPEALPQRVPAEPDVPTVPEPEADEPPTQAPELARIWSHLRREDVPPRPEGFDVKAVLEAVQRVPGVREAKLRTNPGGGHNLRLELADGADAAQVSRKVTQLLQEQMGLSASPREVSSTDLPRAGGTPPAPAAPDTGRGRRRTQSRAESVARGRAHVEAPSPEQAAQTQAATPGSDADGPNASPAGHVERAVPTPGPLFPRQRPGPRVLIDQVQVSTYGLDATVEVRLTAGPRRAVGLSSGPAVDSYLLRLTADAAVKAINQLLRAEMGMSEPPGQVYLEQAAVVPLGSCDIAIVVLYLACGGWVEQLAGSAMVSGDARQSVVRATLSAMNRRLEALLS